VLSGGAKGRSGPTTVAYLTVTMAAWTIAAACFATVAYRKGAHNR
jgi:hypothetical protein